MFGRFQNCKAFYNENNSEHNIQIDLKNVRHWKADLGVFISIYLRTL